MLKIEYGEGIDLEKDLNDVYFSKLYRLGSVRFYKRNAYLYTQGDEATRVFILKSGMVKATCSDENGHETLLKLHGPGNLLGLSALRPTAIRDANGIVLEKAEVSCFNGDEFFDFLRADGELGVLLVRVLLKRQQELHSRLGVVTGHSVQQRLARALLQLHAEISTRAPPGAEIILPVTHEELATMVLSRRQYVTEILRTFVADGLIENHRRRIRIINPRKLDHVFSSNVGR